MTKSTTSRLLALALSFPFLQACHSYYYNPGPGGWHHGGWGHHPHPHHPFDRFSMLEAQDTDVEPSSNYFDSNQDLRAQSFEKSVEALAHKYNIEIGSAEKIIQLAGAEKGNERKIILKEVGIDSKEIKQIFKNLKMPSKETVEKIAHNLGEDESKIEQMIQDFIVDIHSEK